MGPLTSISISLSQNYYESGCGVYLCIVSIFLSVIDKVCLHFVCHL